MILAHDSIAVSLPRGTCALFFTICLMSRTTRKVQPAAFASHHETIILYLPNKAYLRCEPYEDKGTGSYK